MYVTVPQLHRRGWTTALIRRHLGDPDALTSNPHYWARDPMRLYLRRRVSAAERSVAWQDGAAKAEARSKVSSGIADEKRKATIAEAEALPIEIPAQPLDDVTRMACIVYEVHIRSLPFYEDVPRWSEMTSERDREFIRGLTVEYIHRTALSRCDKALNLRRKTGSKEAREVLARRIYSAIGQVYPELADTCRDYAQKAGAQRAN